MASQSKWCVVHTMKGNFNHPNANSLARMQNLSLLNEELKYILYGLTKIPLYIYSFLLKSQNKTRIVILQLINWNSKRKNRNWNRLRAIPILLTWLTFFDYLKKLILELINTDFKQLFVSPLPWRISWIYFTSITFQVNILMDRRETSNGIY